MKLIMILKDLTKLFRMRIIVASLPLNLTMGESSRMRGLISFAANLESSTTSHHKDSTVEWSCREKESFSGGTCKSNVE